MSPFIVASLNFSGLSAVSKDNRVESKFAFRQNFDFFSSQPHAAKLYPLTFRQVGSKLASTATPDMASGSKTSPRLRQMEEYRTSTINEGEPLNIPGVGGRSSEKFDSPLKEANMAQAFSTAKRYHF